MNHNNERTGAPPPLLSKRLEKPSLETLTQSQMLEFWQVSTRTHLVEYVIVSLVVGLNETRA